MIKMSWAMIVLAALASLPAEDLPRGQVVDRVPCLGDPDQSYALYLPSGYRPERSWPIVYCFDPGGRGGIPIALFKEGAEKLGYILAGSNNSRNGPWEAIFKAARSVWVDTHARLAIDDRRVYAAGFSGGARAACGLGKMLSIPLAGMIGCGGGLPEWLAPADLAETAWFGTVGLFDFNYQEMRELDRKLLLQGSPRHLETFIGPHSWPPPELATAALEWLELQAMKRRQRPLDEVLVSTWQESALARAAQLEAAGEQGKAYLEYREIASDFEPFPAAAKAREKAAALEDSAQVKKYLRSEEAREDEYAAQLRQVKSLYMQLAGSLAEPGLGKKIITQLRIPILRKRAAETEISPEQVAAKRILTELFGKAADDGEMYLSRRDGPRAILAFQILAAIRPDHPQVLYGLACARALNGERKKALKCLADAVALGFADREAMASDPAWERLRTDPEFVTILASIHKAL